MIIIDRVTTPNYTMMIEGNGGEEQLVILGTCGIIAISVSAGDGTPKIFYRGECTKQKLTKMLTRWCLQGIQPDPVERELIDSSIKRAVRKFQKTFHFDSEF